MSIHTSNVGLETFKDTVDGVHIPRLMVSEECDASCARLARLAGEAALKCMTVPGDVVDVVCEGPKWSGKCRADLVATGAMVEMGDDTSVFPNVVADAVTNKTPSEIALRALRGVQDGTMHMVSFSDLKS